MGLGTQMIAWHEDFCTRARRQGPARGALRQPRHRALDATSGRPRRRSPSCFGAPSARPTTRSPTWPTTPPGCWRARARAGARDRRLDGRDDRPDARGPPPGARALARLDHVQHGQHAQRAAGAQGLLRLPAPGPPPVATRSSSTWCGCSMRSARPGCPATARTSASSPRSASIATTTATGAGRQLAAIIASGDRTRVAAFDHRADARHPRHRRSARGAVGRAGDGPGDPGREPDDDRGHGPRPATGGVAEDHRRDRRARRACRRGPHRAPTPTGPLECAGPAGIGLPFSSSSTPGGASAVVAQAAQGVFAPAHAPMRCLRSRAPVAIGSAFRAAQRRATVQSPEHASLVAADRAHRHQASFPVPAAARRNSRLRAPLPVCSSRIALGPTSMIPAFPPLLSHHLDCPHPLVGGSVPQRHINHERRGMSTAVDSGGAGPRPFWHPAAGGPDAPGGNRTRGLRLERPLLFGSPKRTVDH